MVLRAVGPADRDPQAGGVGQVRLSASNIVSTRAWPARPSGGFTFSTRPTRKWSVPVGDAAPELST